MTEHTKNVPCARPWKQRPIMKPCSESVVARYSEIAPKITWPMLNTARRPKRAISQGVSRISV